MDTPATHELIIRPGSRFDLAGMESLMREAYAQAKWQVPPYDPEHCWVRMLDLIRRQQVVTAELGGEVVGILALTAEAWPWNPGFVYFTNEHFYVAAKHRDGGVADKLIETAKQVCETRGVPIWLKLTFGTEPEVLQRWGQRHGFEVMGANLWYEKRAD